MFCTVLEPDCNSIQCLGEKYETEDKIKGKGQNLQVMSENPGKIWQNLNYAVKLCFLCVFVDLTENIFNSFDLSVRLLVKNVFVMCLHN